MRVWRVLFTKMLAGAIAVSVLAPADVSADAVPVVDFDPITVTAAARWLVVTDTAGRVLFRPAQAGEALRFAKKGAELGPDETATTGHRARLELLGGPDGERWRLGQRTVFQSRPGGGRLLAGTALIVVPTGEVRSIETFGSFARLAEGTWVLQAVENEGLKVICLDGPARLETEAKNDAGGWVSVALRMKPGELIFLRPGGRGFGPLVTIYLEELLATSRLVRGFAEPLPRMTRLMNQAIAQREQLKGLTSALVAGAKSDNEFQIVLPRPGKTADEGPR